MTSLRSGVKMVLMKKVYFFIIFLLVSCSSEKKNIDDILIHQKIDSHFSKREIKKYTTNVGIPKPQKAMNIYPNIFKRDFELVQIIFNEVTREIYSINGIYDINPDKCINIRNQKINDFKIFSKINENFTMYKEEQNYRKSNYNRGVSRIGYFHNEDKYYVALTCYDNRNASNLTGQPYQNKGELRFEVISDKYKLK